jgi:hypothetical protein
MLNRTLNIRQLLQTRARQLPEARYLIREYSGRQVRFFPQLPKPVPRRRFHGADAPQFYPRGVRYSFEQMQAKLIDRVP